MEHAAPMRHAISQSSGAAPPLDSNFCEKQYSSDSSLWLQKGSYFLACCLW